jgi:hypothetical protein
MMVCFPPAIDFNLEVCPIENKHISLLIDGDSLQTAANILIHCPIHFTTLQLVPDSYLVVRLFILRLSVQIALPL